ncbi:hypothetical protein ACFVFS_17445 [Kitasatospora sp. NPDC057692]|uniref:hypothetical protein n=1 Tax=Kitasatospora sp. NPDC057692 TaxID=3346215 RepID=UPI00369440E0
MTCPDDLDDGEWDAELLFTDDSEDWPDDPPTRPVTDVIPDLAHYQPRSTAA